MATANTIDFYRTRIDKDVLRELTEKSDWKGLLHAGSFLLIFLGTIGLSLYFYLQQMWVAMVAASYIHCIFHGFVGMGAAVHELSHGTAFKTKWLNTFFYKLFAFLTWNSHFHFKESHRRHHLNTGFMERDMEIPREPIPQKWYHVIGYFTLDWEMLIRFFKTNIAHAFGNTDVDFFFWCPLLSKDNIKTRKLISWARFLLIGHAILAAIFIYFELYILIFTVTFGYFFATFLVHGCEVQQHAGLGRDIPDWRVVAYTADFGPLMSYLYWNMNYHIEHHMYAGVPFYNLPRLNKVMKSDLPRPLKGYWRGLAHVIRMKRKQKADPDYRFMPEFPETANPPKLS